MFRRSSAPSLFARTPKTARRTPSRRPMLRLNHLEDRLAPAVFVVSNNLDGAVTGAGQLPGSLRQAISDANALSGTDTIDATGVSGTIGLSQGQLTISDAVTITGPGSATLTVQNT